MGFCVGVDSRKVDRCCVPREGAPLVNLIVATLLREYDSSKVIYYVSEVQRVSESKEVF